MATSTHLVARLGVAARAVSLAACSSSGNSGKSASKSTPSTPAGVSSPSSVPSSSSSSASTTDYTSLLLDTADIPVSGLTKGTPTATPQGSGATVAFTATGGRTLGDTIVVLPDAAAAQAAAQQSVAAAKQGITGAVASDAPIGSGGTALRGTKGDAAVAVLIFAEGRAVVVLEFDSSASDPVPTAVIQQVADAQDKNIKSGLTG